MLIYDNKVRLTFSEGSHKYMVSKLVGKDAWTKPEGVIGVTSVLQTISKPALMAWPVNESKKFLMAHIGKKLTKELVEEASTAYRKKSQHGKDAGTIIHELVEKSLKGEEITIPDDPEIKSGMKAFELWREDFAPEPLYVEQKFYSKDYNYAGTCDLIANIGGKLTVVDFKTANSSYYQPDGIYNENFAQAGGYMVGLEEMLGLEFEEAMIVNLPKDGSEYKYRCLGDSRLTLLEAKLTYLSYLWATNSTRDLAWKLS